MKLLIFCNHFYPRKGGMETYLLELCTRLVKKKIEVTVICFNTESMAALSMIKGIEVYRLPYKYLFKRERGSYIFPKKDEEYKWLMTMINSKNYDFVITNTRFLYSSYMGMKYAQEHNIRHIHIEHGNSFVKQSNPIIKLLSIVYDLTFGKAVFKNAWKTIGISIACCKFAKRMGARHVELIYNSIDVKKFQRVKTNLKERLGINNEKVVTYVGRLIHAKGIHNLLEATKDMPYVKVLIVGSGPYESELKKIASNNVVFLGERNQKQIIEILSITDVFVNPSFSEGLPTSVLEARAMNIPIVATDVGGTREILNGLLINPHDVKDIEYGILKALHAGTFDWDMNIYKFLEVLK